MSERLQYSVLMPVYFGDKAEYFNSAIESMVNQTVAFHDMVVVCDGPVSCEVDGVLSKWREKLGIRLRVCQLAVNSGLAVALTEGLALCECDVVARMDADDIARPRRCELLLDLMLSGDLDIVGGAIEEFNKQPGDMGVIRRMPTRQSEIESYAKKRNPFNHMTVVFKKPIVVAVGGYQDWPLLEDYWLWVRMIAAGCRCGNTQETVVDVRTGEGMYIRRRGLSYLKNQIRLFRTMRGGALSAEWTRFRLCSHVSSPPYCRRNCYAWLTIPCSEGGYRIQRIASRALKDSAR